MLLMTYHVLENVMNGVKLDEIGSNNNLKLLTVIYSVINRLSISKLSNVMSHLARNSVKPGYK